MPCRAQETKEKSAWAASRIKDLYNQKKFIEIHALFNANLKKEIKQQAFIDFMDKEIYQVYGEMESCEFLKEEAAYHSYITHMRMGDLKMNLELDTSNLISMIQFLPYRVMPKTKITDYLSDNPGQSRLDSALNSIVKDYMQSPQNCGLSIGIIRNGKEYYYNYGETSRNSKSLPAKNTMFEIGSLSKTFCGILLAHAILEKKVNADDDIRKYLPDKDYKNLEANGKPITLVQLANHSSGLPRVPEDIQGQNPYDPLNPYKNYKKEMLFNYLQRVELSSQPGKICSYSNTGMALLGIILEKVYGKSFEELIKEKICAPLGMPNTGMKLNEAQAKLMAKGYNTSGKETPYWDLGDLCAAGGLRSNPVDMMHYLEQNMEEKDEALKLSHQPTFTDGNTIGMAWHVMKNRQGNTMVWHNGATFGFSSFTAFIKEKNCGVFILSNSGTTVDHLALQILKFIQN
jgi:CubicO group peptidase (beta-lactamase class C family)